MIHDAWSRSNIDMEDKMWAWRSLFMSVLVAIVLGTMSTAAEARDKTGVLKTSDVIGMKVEGIDNKSLGTIKDLVLDPVDGGIQYAVLDF